MWCDSVDDEMFLIKFSFSYIKTLKALKTAWATQKLNSFCLCLLIGKEY